MPQSAALVDCVGRACGFFGLTFDLCGIRPVPNVKLSPGVRYLETTRGVVNAEMVTRMCEKHLDDVSWTHTGIFRSVVSSLVARPHPLREGSGDIRVIVQAHVT